MTDIYELTSILRQFAEDKSKQAEKLLEQWPGKPFRAHDAEKARDLQHQAIDLRDYAKEIEEWWEKRNG